ncbi:LacI family DNA-binding transcriptional regulator [Lentilactobacillus kisonensis]
MTLKAKIADIAKIAGLSVASVSRILNGRGRYSEETAKRVRQIADDIGYYKNRSASDLARQSNNTFGVVYTNSETHFSEPLIKGIMGQAATDKLDVIIMIGKRDDEQGLTKIVQDMIERRVFGLLFLSIQPSQSIIDILNHANIRALVVGSATEHDVSYISSDDFQIGYQATQFLIDKGYQRIGLAGMDVQRDYVGLQRYQGYRQALKEANMKAAEGLVHSGNFSYHSGITAATYYTNEQSVDAVIGASDEVSLGLLNGFHDLGVQVPKQVGLISIDGTELCEQSRPKMTSVTQNFQLMGTRAVREFMALEDSHNKIETVTIPFEIETRNTTKQD